MGLIIFLVLQAFAIVAGGAYVWRRLEAQDQEIIRLRERLGDTFTEAEVSAAPRLRVATTANVTPLKVTAPVSVSSVAPAQSRRAQLIELWRQIVPANFSLPAPLRAQPETVHGAILGAAAAAPAISIFFGAPRDLIVLSGIVIGALMILSALVVSWRAAPWAAVFTAGAWALTGFVLHVAHAAPFAYSIGLALAGVSGLLFAYRRETAPGAVMCLVMSAAALALGSQIGMIGAPGVSFATLVALAAITGALHLRLEGIFIAAFGAALIGLFVMSGQHDAAIWFTPVTAWAGALFFAIAAVRVPRAGARAVAIAGVGALAPLLAIGALYQSHQGLADPRGAAGAFAALAALIGLVIALSAQRHGRGVGALKLTLWVLTAGAMTASVSAVLLGLAPPFAAPAFTLLAVLLMAVDQQAPDAVWRLSACVAGALAAFCAILNIGLVLNESQIWDPRLVVSAGLAAPAAFAAGAAVLAQRSSATSTGAIFKFLAIALSVAVADVLVRLIFSGGAPLLQPIGFAEAGAHISSWLLIGLFSASRARRGAVSIRIASATMLGALAVAASVACALLWLTPYWAALPPPRTGIGLLRWEGLGFAAPAIFFWAHWVFWRARGANVRTRLALGAGALMSACLVALEALRIRENGAGPDTVSALLGALAFAAAIMINFAPGVVASPARRSYLQENFQGDRRRHQRRQAG